jgi:hypothetical protein
LLILLLAAGLRIAGITFDSLWLDESYQTMVDAYGQPLPDFTAVPDKPYRFEFGAPREVSEVLQRFRQVDPLCPPLHAVLLNRWMTVFGGGDAAVRALSVVFSLLSLSALYVVVYFLFGPRAAMFAGLVHALSPFDIHYAQEARMYTLLTFAAIVSMGSLLAVSRCWQQAVERGGRGSDLINVVLLVMHALGAWTLINTHYTGLFVFMAEILFGLWTAFVLRRWSFLFACMAAWAGVALIWLPWLPLFFQAAKMRTESFYVARDAHNWWWTFFGLLRIVVNWIIFLAGKKVIVWWATPVYVTSFALLVFGLLASSRLRRYLTGPSLPLTGVWMWLLVPPVVLFVSDLMESHRVVEIPRYVMATSPAVYILGGLGLNYLDTAAPRLARWFLALHCVFSLLSNLSAHVIPQREPWSQVAQEIEKLVGPDDLVLIAQPYDLVCLNRYLTRPLLQVGVSPVLGAKNLSRIIDGRREFYLITAQEGEAVTRLIPGDWEKVLQKNFYNGLHLRRFTRMGDAKEPKIGSP